MNNDIKCNFAEVMHSSASQSHQNKTCKNAIFCLQNDVLKKEKFFGTHGGAMQCIKEARHGSAKLIDAVDKTSAFSSHLFWSIKCGKHPQDPRGYCLSLDTAAVQMALTPYLTLRVAAPMKQCIGEKTLWVTYAQCVKIPFFVQKLKLKKTLEKDLQGDSQSKGILY